MSFVFIRIQIVYYVLCMNVRVMYVRTAPYIAYSAVCYTYLYTRT